jgi:hypothetical protein
MACDILWMIHFPHDLTNASQPTSRIHKEEINARSRPSGGFSVRAAVSAARLVQWESPRVAPPS